MTHGDPDHQGTGGDRDGQHQQWQGYGQDRAYGQGQAYGQDPAYGQGQPYEQRQDYGSPGTYPSQPAQPLAGNRVEAKGFFAALFDFSFRSFITVSFARVIYAILVAVAVISWLLPALVAFTDSAGTGFTLLLLGWIPGFVLIIIYRIALEVTVSMVRTSQNTAATREEIELLRRDLRGRA